MNVILLEFYNFVFEYIVFRCFFIPFFHSSCLANRSAKKRCILSWINWKNEQRKKKMFKKVFLAEKEESLINENILKN